MKALYLFLVYILVGAPLDWISIAVTWGRMLHICAKKDRLDIYDEVHKKWWSRRVGLPLHVEGLGATIGSLIFWPIVVLNNFYFGGHAVREARDRIRSLDETEKEGDQ